MPHIAVLGAGIAGITSASKLIDQGFDVTIIDRQAYPAMETSFANGGQLSASNAEVWNATSTILKGLKWLLRKDAPLSMNLWPSWHKYSWLAEFVAAIPRHDANTIETARLAQLARGHLLEMASRAGIDFDLEKRGIIHFYKDHKEFAAGRKATALLARAGLDREEMDADGLRRIEPTLPQDILGGFYTASDFSGDIHKFSTGLARHIAARGGRFMMNVQIGSVQAEADHVVINVSRDGHDEEQFQFDGVVVAAGTGSRDLAAQFGDRVNVYPVKGYSITVQLDDAASRRAAPVVSLLDERAKVVTSRLGADRFRIAGTAEFNGSNRDIRADRIKPLLDWSRANFPDVSTRHATPWAGLRPMMPNMMPRMGQGRSDRVFYNTGHGHLGWTLSAATADIVARQMASAYFGLQTKPDTRRRAAASVIQPPASSLS